MTQVPAVLDEGRAPRHLEFAADGKTAWRLFNAFTKVWKGRHFEALPRRSQALHGLLDAACGLAARVLDYCQFQASAPTGGGTNW
jgi:hypothetical protein